MHNLRNIIKRRNVTSSPSKRMDACEDVFVTVVEAHIVCAALQLFGMNSPDDTPSIPMFPQGCLEFDKSRRNAILMTAAQNVVENFVSICYGLQQGCSRSADNDHVKEYACDVLNLGLMLMEFKDSIREGDGERIIRCWRYLLPLFKVSGRKNYCIEAFTLLAQYSFLLLPRNAMQLMWSRTVNVHGKPGKNISCDLHLEHLNREAKNCIAGLGANITEEAVKRTGKSIGPTVTAISNFDMVNGIKKSSINHSKHSCLKDIDILVKQLHDSSAVFNTVPGRKHRSFKKYKANCIKNITVPELSVWMNKQWSKIIASLPL